MGHVEKVFEQPVQLGPIAIYISKARVSESCLKKIQIGLADATQQKFEVSFESVDDAEAEIFELNSLPKDAKLPPEVQQLFDDKVVDELLERQRTMAKSRFEPSPPIIP